MTEAKSLEEIEAALQKRYNPSLGRQFTSDSTALKHNELVQDLVLPVEARGRMPLTKEQYLVNENPAKVEWERHIRVFLSRLNTRQQGHRITAAMIFEWTTGRTIKEIAEAEGADKADGRGGGKAGSANAHLRIINGILKEYFGTPYKTKIAGREVGRAYRVKQHFSVRYKKPIHLALWPEWDNGTLDA